MPERRILVTGGADGIGRAIASAFAAQGDRVLLVDRDAARVAATAAELGAAAHVCDVTDAEAVAALAASIGRIDVLVNNAGIGDSHLPTAEQDAARFRMVLDVNLTGSFLMAQAVGGRMVRAGGGAIVNLASIAGLTGLPRRNAYGAAKAGVVALTRNLACEWARFGVRVNAVAPAYVDTALVRAIAESGRMDLGKVRRRTPMGRLIGAHEVAAAVVFLASDAASAITGVTLPVDGGWSAFGDFGDASADTWTND